MGSGNKDKDTAKIIEQIQEKTLQKKRVSKKKFFKKLGKKLDDTQVQESKIATETAKKKSFFKKPGKKPGENKPHDKKGREQAKALKILITKITKKIRGSFKKRKNDEKEKEQEEVQDIQTQHSQTEQKPGIFNRLKQKPILLSGLIAAAVLLLGGIGYFTYSIITQTESYNNDIAGLKQRVKSYQSILDEGFYQNNAEFMSMLVLYQETLADYSVYADELLMLNESSDYIFVFGKKKIHELGIDKLEASSIEMSGEIAKVDGVIDSMAVLEKDLKAIVKSKENTVDDVISELRKLDDSPEIIK